MSKNFYMPAYPEGNFLMGADNCPVAARMTSFMYTSMAGLFWVTASCIYFNRRNCRINAYVVRGEYSIGRALVGGEAVRITPAPVFLVLRPDFDKICDTPDSYVIAMVCAENEAEARRM